MNDFLHNDSNRAEDMLMDPLILHADLVKDSVIEEVKNPKMPKRRYAISFLGVARLTNALPVLKIILSDTSEVDYFRADALESIYQISPEEGRQLAKRSRGETNSLGSIARRLLDGSHHPFERSLDDAKTGRHY